MKRFKRLIPLVSPYLNGTSEPVPSDFDQLDSLGGGAFAMVYKVRNRNTKEIYALKAIKKDTILQNKKVDSVKRELEIMYQLNHENVIRLYGHYEDEDHINLLLEYIPGGNLYDLIKKNERLSEQDAIYYMRQVVAAITYLHSQPTPVLHRDIKPENILLDGNRKVKLGDFGSANSVTSDKKRYTFEGTKIYMAPEIYQNQGYDQTVDIWSLGVLIFELLSGQTPFFPTEQRETLNDRDIDLMLEENIKTGKIVFPQDFPAMARDIVRKMLKTDPAQRLTLKEIIEHSWMKQKIENEDTSQTNEPNTQASRIEQSIKRFKEKQNDEQTLSNKAKFDELKGKIISLKSQISQYQVDIQRTQLENENLSEKLKKIQQGSQQQEDSVSENENEEDSNRDMSSSTAASVITPAKIQTVENKFNTLTSKIKRLQREIIDKETEIAKHQFQQDLHAQLENKLAREKQTVEKLEKELLQLDSTKKAEYAKLEQVYIHFSKLNNDRSLQLKNKPSTEKSSDNQSIQQLKTVVDKLKRVIELHKDLIANPDVLGDQGNSSDEEDQTQDLETMIDEQLDQKLTELQTEYDSKKLQMKQDLKQQFMEIQKLEEENQKLKSEVKQIREKDLLIQKGHSIIKNLEFQYQVKKESVRELEERKKEKEDKLLQLQDKFNDQKQMHP